jgi:hypothetical protein
MNHAGIVRGNERARDLNGDGPGPGRLHGTAGDPGAKRLAIHVLGGDEEVIVDLLIARGEYDAALRRYLEERGDRPL